jgi:hypothetical protein
MHGCFLSRIDWKSIQSFNEYQPEGSSVTGCPSVALWSPSPSPRPPARELRYQSLRCYCSAADAYQVSPHRKLVSVCSTGQPDPGSRLRRRLPPPHELPESLHLLLRRGGMEDNGMEQPRPLGSFRTIRVVHRWPAATGWWSTITGSSLCAAVMGGDPRQLRNRQARCSQRGSLGRSGWM